MLDPQTLERLEPNLRKGMAGGLLVPEDVVLYPPCAARFLIERAQAAGAKLHLGSSVSQIGKGVVRLADGTEFSAAAIVNAAGAWASALTPGLSVKKRKGHLAITDRYPGFVRHQLVELGYLKSAHSSAADSVAFNVQPRRTGQILIGSSRQYGAEHGEVDNGILARMLRRAQEYMPKLAELSTIRVWTGFRAATPDKLPLIGPWPGDPTLFLATGHEGLGITTSLATARLLVDQIARQKSCHPGRAVFALSGPGGARLCLSRSRSPSTGRSIAVPPGATVAVAIVLAGAACRKSVSGETRGPLCGMGICFECRAVIRGATLPHLPDNLPARHGSQDR